MRKKDQISGKPVSQKFLAEQLGLSPTTVSLVMTGAPLADRISPETKARIKAAAKQFDCRPDFYARYLTRKRTYTVALLMPEMCDGFMASIVAGADKYLVGKKYFYFLANHDGRQELVDEFPGLLMERAVEGFILVNTPLTSPLGRPTVSIGRLANIEGVGQVKLDNEYGGELALKHLVRMGHRKIAVIKGYGWNGSAAERLVGIQRAAQAMGVEISSRAIVELDVVNKSVEPEAGYKATQQLLSRKIPFTGIVAFNDVAAIGAIRALHDAGLNVPSEVSVIGFDDINAAAYQIPGLTTLRQPMRYMGEIAAEMLLKMIEKKNGKAAAKTLLVKPELVLRESTKRI